MANEKRTSVSFSVVAGGETATMIASLSEDLAGGASGNFLGGSFAATTSWAAIPVTGLASVDILAIKNQDDTNYIQVAIANDDSGIFARLTPGRPMHLPAEPGTTYYVRANTAACNYKLAITEP